MRHLPFWPPEASAEAVKVDTIVVVMLVLAGAILLLVAGLLIVFCVRYRRGSPARRGEMPQLIRREVEIGWTAGTTFLALFLFAWAAIAALAAHHRTDHALQIHILARQWMWKAEHPNGASEIDALHLPVGEDIRLTMQSQDVIHSFYVPAFRLKQDVVPGRVSELVFRPVETGVFPLYCAEFCGTLHARMTGTVVVMAADAYAAWRDAQPRGNEMARQGRALFVSAGCADCHAAGTAVHAPSLVGLYGREVVLQDGRHAQVDEQYLRDAILQPGRDIVAGYAPVMPSYAGRLADDEIQQLLAYLRSLREDPS